jgi:hypothetical protein
MLITRKIVWWNDETIRIKNLCSKNIIVKFKSKKKSYIYVKIT